MDEQAKRKRPTYSDEFKRDAVRLVVEQGYSFKAACQAIGVCDATLRDWHRKLAPPPEPCGDDATVDELNAERNSSLATQRQANNQPRLIPKLPNRQPGAQRRRSSLKT